VEEDQGNKVAGGDEAGNGRTRHNDGRDVDESSACTVRQRGPRSDGPSPPLSKGTVRSGGPPPATKTLCGSQRGTAWSKIDRGTPTERHCGWWLTTSLPECAAHEPGGDPRPPATPPPPSQIVLGAVADRLPPANRCAGACPGATRDPLRPPPPSRGSQTGWGGLPPETFRVGVGLGRPRDLVQPPSPPLRRSVSVLGGPPQPSDRMVVMTPRDPSIVPTPTGPQEPRSGVTRQERSPLHACLSHMSDPVPRGPQLQPASESDHETPTTCCISLVQWTKAVGPLLNAEVGPHRQRVHVCAIIFQD